jgi:hypothetical protein
VCLLLSVAASTNIILFSFFLIINNIITVVGDFLKKIPSSKKKEKRKSKFKVGVNVFRKTKEIVTCIWVGNAFISGLIFYSPRGFLKEEEGEGK